MRCWDQWIRKMSFKLGPGSGLPLQTSRREDNHNVRNAHVQPTASSATIFVQVAPSLRATLSSLTIRMFLVEEHLESRHAPIMCAALDAHPSSVWSGATHEETGLQWNGTRSSLATNPDSISAVMTIVFVCGDLVVNVSILPLLLQRHTVPTAGVMVWGAIAYITRSSLVLIHGTMTA
ncbi:uncharacterized protein TNCV_4442041 [Trichonephila clavipes]|nr:uncharacterized protein TNCV_4442041 [Trichonephila clavipes]